MARTFLSVSFAAALVALSAGSFSVAHADEQPTFEITIKDHKFDPSTLEVPAGKEVKLVVKNLDATAEEFESYDLNREKIIAGGGQGVFFLEPMKPGTYKFFGEFHQDTAQGVIIAK